MVACQAPLSWNFLGKNTGVGCRFLLQGIFPIQGSNPCLLHWQVGSLPLSTWERSCQIQFPLTQRLPDPDAVLPQAGRETPRRDIRPPHVLEALSSS